MMFFCFCFCFLEREGGGGASSLEANCDEGGHCGCVLLHNRRCLSPLLVFDTLNDGVDNCGASKFGGDKGITPLL